MSALTRIPKALVAAVVALLLVVVFVSVHRGPGTRTVTAHFSRAVSLFKHSEVRILGVRVGEVTAVIPEGDTVKVVMKYDAEYKIPKDAQAVIITPTLTADRFVQLTPAYTSGPEMPDGGDIAVQDTGTPIELDRIYRSLADLTKALGPNGVNKNGTLDNVLTAGTKFLKGEGAKANATIINLSKAVKTFGDGSGELFGTVDALNEFSIALADNDKAVSTFMANLGQVTHQLAGEKDELYAALHNLAGVLGKVEGFVKGNRVRLVGDLSDLGSIMKVMAAEKTALETVLNIAPAAMGNLAIAWDARSQSIGSRINVGGNVVKLPQLLCTLVKLDHLPAADQACTVFDQLLGPVFGNVPASSKSSLGSDNTEAVQYGSALPAKDLSALLGGDS